MSEMFMAGILFVGVPFLVVAFVSWILHYFVALKSPPTRRALWIVGIGYFAASVAWLLGGPEGERWEGPIAAIPGGLIAFWWWRDDFRRDWIDDDQGVPEGVELANTNRRVGLLGVGTLFAIAILKVVFRTASTGH